MKEEEKQEDPVLAAESEDVEFPCGQCGASMSWDPDADALTCAYCGNRVEVPRTAGTIVERALEDAPEAQRGLGIELRVTACDSCGARVTFDGKDTAERCVFCGSPNVLAQDANRNAIRPESLVPLDVGRDEVRANFQGWLKSLWFRPNALKKAQTSQAVGIYVPFWTFDAQVHSDWSADSGTYYYVTVPYTTMVNGKPVTRTRQERRTRWSPAWGSRDDVYDDHAVHASLGQPGDLVRQLGDFALAGLVPYQPEYLAGWRAEEYSVDLEAGWGIARDEIVASQDVRCGGDVPGDTYRNLSVRNRIRDVRWKHVLLPIWSLQYRFRGKVYTVLVHGQSGKVVGKAPYSWAKISLLVLSIVVVVGAAALAIAATN